MSNKEFGFMSDSYAQDVAELINVLLEVSRHSDSLMEYVSDDYEFAYDRRKFIIYNEHNRIIGLVNDTVVKYEGVEDE